MLDIIIVDDEPLACENLRCLLQQRDDVNIVAECANAIEAISAIHQFHPDVVFLDIEMPKITGLEMLKMIDPNYMPYIVFVTAYDEYAVNAFEEQAFDYLLKPIESVRLEKTLQRLVNQCPTQDLSILTETKKEYLPYIPCIGHSRIYLLNSDEVLYACSKISGISVVTKTNNEYFTKLTLRILEDKTPLIRCHRQYLVNIDHLKEIRFNKENQTEVVLTNNFVVPISRRYLKTLKERLGW